MKLLDLIALRWRKPDLRVVPLTGERPQPKLEDCVKDKYDGNPLVCSGCAHSSGSEKFPGSPSGERPCFFCIRNPDREAWVEQSKKDWPNGELPEQHPANGHWYNGSKAMKVPMDCYRSVDMLRQAHLWDGGKEDDLLIT